MEWAKVLTFSSLYQYSNDEQDENVHSGCSVNPECANIAVALKWKLPHHDTKQINQIGSMLLQIKSRFVFPHTWNQKGVKENTEDKYAR